MAKKIDGALPAGSAEDTKIVGRAVGAAAQDDLLVLTKNPNKVWLYPGATPCLNPLACTGAERKTFISSFPAGFDPMGMVFDPNGNPLFAGLGGSVIRVTFGTGPGFTPSFQTVKSGLGNGLFGIAAGPQQGKNRAFVFQRNNHRAYSFDVVNGAFTNQRIVNSGLTFPQKGGIGTATWVSTGTGPTSVQVGSVNNTFNAKDPGYIDRKCKFTNLDPRELGESCCASNCPAPGPSPDPPDLCTDDGFCQRPLLLTDIAPGTPNATGVTIPANIRSFFVCDPDHEGHRFYVCTGDTTVGLDPSAPIIAHTEDENSWLKCEDEPPIDVGDVTKQARFQWGAIPALEAPLVEGNLFVDFSTPGNSNRAETDDYSFVLPAVTDLRPLCTIADDKLANEEATRDMFSSNIDGPLNDTLTDALCSARAALREHSLTESDDCEDTSDPGECGDPGDGCDYEDEIDNAICHINFFIDELKDNIADVDNPTGPPPRNLAGELLSRADSAKYFLCKIDGFPTMDDLCPPSAGH